MKKNTIKRALAGATAFLLALTIGGGTKLTAKAENNKSSEDKTGSITVENAQTNSTYKAYKIFDVTYDKTNDPDAYSYTIDESSAWYTAVSNYASNTNSGLTLANVEGTTTYNVSTTEAFSAPAFAQYLRGYVNGSTGENDPADITDNNTKTLTNGSVRDLDLGYWFVTTTTGTLCNLTTTNPNAQIYDKNVINFEKTESDYTAEVGQTVTYTLRGKVPDTTGYTAYTYKVEDAMTSGLTFNKDVKIVFGGNNNTAKTVVIGTAGENETAYNVADNGNTAAPTVNYYTANADKNKFDVTFDMTKWQKYVNQDITITYTATVNQDAVQHDEENNQAKLTYSNDPTDSSRTDHTDQETHLYSFNIVIDKYEAGKATQKLANAEFELYKESDDANKTKSYYSVGTDGKVSWVSEGNNAITKVTTDDNGAGQFNGLKAGTYYLLETKAPDGYNKLTGPVTVVINVASQSDKAEPYSISATVDGKAANVAHNADNKISDDTADQTYNNNVTAGIENNKGSLLPSTGGIGTKIFYVAGGILVIGAAVLLISRKNKQNA